MNDVELIQGTWKLESMTTNTGESVGFAGILGAKVHGDNMDEWVNDDVMEYAGDTKLVSKFELFPESTPKRIVCTTNWFDDNRPVKSHTEKGFYELTTDTLTIKWGPDDFPKDDPSVHSQTCVYSRVR